MKNKRYKLLLILTIIIIFNSCIQTENKKIFVSKDSYDTLTDLTNQIDFGEFKLNTPEGWNKIKLIGIDSYVGGIRTNNNDTISFDLGWYSNSLREDTNTHITTFDTIDNYEVKIVKPKQIGKGLTGIYIDSLWMSGSDADRFNLFGYDLCPEDQKQFLKAIRTIKFKENKENGR